MYIYIYIYLYIYILLDIKIGVGHVINSIFLEYSKEGKLSSSHIGIRNIPADVCYDDTKHY